MSAASDRRRAETAQPASTGGVNRMRSTHLWVAQRVTAMILAVAVVVHLVTILVAIRGGLSAAEILGRTRGNEAWLAFYAIFALAAGLHGAIGLRGIAAEWLGLRGRGFDFAWLAIGLLTAFFGIRAAVGLYA
jgi:fumarate reductase subunit C